MFVEFFGPRLFSISTDFGLAPLVSECLSRKCLKSVLFDPWKFELLDPIVHTII